MQDHSLDDGRCAKNREELDHTFQVVVFGVDACERCEPKGRAAYGENEARNVVRDSVRRFAFGVWLWLLLLAGRHGADVCAGEIYTRQVNGSCNRIRVGEVCSANG